MTKQTSEEELESQLDFARQELKSVRATITSLKNALSKAETILLGCNVEIGKLTEELRRFRLKYPAKCKVQEEL